MAEDQDESQKTEEPTQRRIEESVKKGQVAFSREVTSFLMLMVLALVIGWLSPHLMRQATLRLQKFIESPESIPVDPGSMRLLFVDASITTALALAIPALAMVVAAFLSSFMQNGFISSVEPIIPKLEKISPLTGLKRMFSMKSIVEFIKGLIKITIIGAVSYIAVSPELGKLGEIHNYSIAGILAFILHLSVRILIGACVVMAVIAILDFLYQRFEYLKSLRMSKHDLKEEYKQAEGNPEVKAKLKSIRMERARQRMMAAVPTADVIITNPTHFSIALKYDRAVMAAPTCVAKGQDNIALKIREIAKEHDVPIVENKPLARALFDSVEIDQEIPLEHYKAVAEIIGYVYKMKGKVPT